MLVLCALRAWKTKKASGALSPLPLPLATGLGKIRFVCSYLSRSRSLMEKGSRAYSHHGTGAVAHGSRAYSHHSQSPPLLGAAHSSISHRALLKGSRLRSSPQLPLTSAAHR
jgi:hypothetical protein